MVKYMLPPPNYIWVENAPNLLKFSDFQYQNRIQFKLENLMKYKVHHFDIKMTKDQVKLEQFLNSLQGEVVAVIPNVTMKIFWIHQINFILIIEKLN